MSSQNSSLDQGSEFVLTGSDALCGHQEEACQIAAAEGKPGEIVTSANKRLIELQVLAKTEAGVRTRAAELKPPEEAIENAKAHGWLVSFHAAITSSQSEERSASPCEVEKRMTALLMRSSRIEQPSNGTGADVAGHDEFFERWFPAPDDRERAKNRRRRSAFRSMVTHMMAGGLGVIICLGLVSRLKETDATEEVRRSPLPSATASSQSFQPDAATQEREAEASAQIVPSPPVVSITEDFGPPPLLEPEAARAVPPSKPVQVASKKPVAFVPLVLRIRRSMPLVAWAADEDRPTVSAPVSKEPQDIAIKKPAKVVAEKPVPLRKPSRRPAVKPKTVVKPVVETEMALLDGGVSVIGDELDGMKDALPHQVKLSPFWIARREVTLELWDRVVNWGRTHGYMDLPPGEAKSQNHPVYGVSWIEAVKWCNARSEMEGLEPCYYEDAGKEKVLRSGIFDLSNRCVNWAAKGYRLPTEAEWEVAARGRLRGKRFPWGDEITHENANYSSREAGAFDKSTDRGPPPAFRGSLPYTSPVGSFKPNGFGLYDMSGNVLEWCWDIYDKFYGIPELAAEGATLLTVSDPAGAGSGSSRVVRGGSWRHDAGEACCARRFDLPATKPFPHVGFRVARRS